jgi:hypothetical protein
MTTDVLSLHLSDNAMSMLEQLVAAKGAGAPTAAQWVRKTIVEAGAGTVARWNLLQAHGRVTLDDHGRVVAEAKDIPPMVVAAGSPNAQFAVVLPIVVMNHVVHCAQLSVAVRAHANLPNPWPTVNAWAEDYLTDAIALALTEVEAAKAKSALDYQERQERVEAERARRKAQLESSGCVSAGGSGGAVAGLVDSDAVDTPPQSGGV